MKTWLLCLFTYNRLPLLANAIRSIDAFFPWGDRLILDDGSSDPHVRHYLDEIAERPNWHYKIMDRVPGRDYGGYYNNMRYALEYAVARGYEYCFFFEDDEQIVWQKDDYPQYVDHVFGICPDAIQIQPLFMRRIQPYARTIEYIQPARAYRSDRGFSTSAIWNLEIVRQHSDYRFICAHGDDLPANSSYWMRKGYRVYLQFDPTVAIIPWISSQSSARVNRSYSLQPLDDRQDLLLKPLDYAEIDFLQTRPPSLPAYQEYFNLSADNKTRPIWHQRWQNLNRYYFLCRNIVEEENRAGQSPVRVPTLDKWAPTKIPHLQSHLDWNPFGQAGKASSWKRFLLPTLHKVHSFLFQLLQFRLRDYLGYLELRRRLRREQESLDFCSVVRGVSYLNKGGKNEAILS